MKIKVTDFGARHFDPKFGGTKILDMTVEDFEGKIELSLEWINDINELDKSNTFGTQIGQIKIIDGYAPFCKLVAIPNFTDARVGSMPITIANYQYIRSGYSARKDDELPVFSRWLELPMGKPKAEWLMLVLYSKEQIDKEAQENAMKLGRCGFCSFDGDYGIVAILGQDVNTEIPMTPVTMMRNALGIEYGGSGVPIDKDRYMKSVDYWEHHAIVN